MADGTEIGGAPPRSWIEVDLDALRANARVASGGGKWPIMAVVKANAYGHGVLPVARALSGEVAYFGVAGVAEADELRDGGVGDPIFLLGAALPAEIEPAIQGGYALSISTLEEAREIDAEARRQGRVAEGHLVFDTGMGRIGLIDPPEAVLKDIAGLDNLAIAGIASHFPSADEDPEFTKVQLAQFWDLVGRARGAGLHPQLMHIANSAGIVGFGSEEDIGSLLRPGLVLYGISPAGEMAGAALAPVMELKSSVSSVREIPEGWGISYGRTFVTPRPMRVATVSIGYADGYPRHLSGSEAEVLIGGKRHPVVGRITMDQIMVDISGAETIRPGDEVILFGRQGGGEIGVAEVASWAGTISWEIMTGIAPRVRRRYLGG